MKKSSQCSSHHSQSVQWEFGDGRCVCKISSTVAKTRRQLKCLPTDEQIKEVWYRKRNIFSPKKEGHPGVPWWLRGLQIQHCHFSGLSSGHHGALMLGLLGTSTGHERGQKKKRMIATWSENQHQTHTAFTFRKGNKTQKSFPGSGVTGPSAAGPPEPSTVASLFPRLPILRLWSLGSERGRSTLCKPSPPLPCWYQCLQPPQGHSQVLPPEPPTATADTRVHWCPLSPAPPWEPETSPLIPPSNRLGPGALYRNACAWTTISSGNRKTIRD